MKRSGFKPKLPKRPVKIYEVHTPRVRPVARPDGRARMTVALPKFVPMQHAGYMDAVRSLPCYRCGVVGFTQFCHADEGKGMGTKTDCRLGWPGCGPHLRNGVWPMAPGCHFEVGTSGKMTRKERRDFEAMAGYDTRALVQHLGMWPEDLPYWPEDADSMVTHNGA